MTKKKEFTFEDFMTKSNFENSRQLPLMNAGEKTEHYLDVIGAHSKSVNRSRIKWAIKDSEIKEKYKDEKDKETLMIDLDQEIEENNITFAMELVVGWSFPDFDKEKLFKLLVENDGLSAGVINHAYAHDGLKQGK